MIASAEERRSRATLRSVRKFIRGGNCPAAATELTAICRNAPRSAASYITGIGDARMTARSRIASEETEVGGQLRVSRLRGVEELPALQFSGESPRSGGAFGRWKTRHWRRRKTSPGRCLCE